MRGRGEIQGIDGAREEGRTLENLRRLPMTSDGLRIIILGVRAGGGQRPGVVKGQGIERFGWSVEALAKYPREGPFFFTPPLLCPRHRALRL